MTNVGRRGDNRGCARVLAALHLATDRRVTFCLVDKGRGSNIDAASADPYP